MSNIEHSSNHRSEPPQRPDPIARVTVHGGTSLWIGKQALGLSDRHHHKPHHHADHQSPDELGMPFLTPRFNAALWAINLSIGAHILVYAVWLVMTSAGSVD